MELNNVLRTTAAVRKFTNRPVNNDTLYEILEQARFAPSGGNRQAWRVIIVHDDTRRRLIRDAYLDAWHEYVGHLLAGLIPFSPLASDADRASALAQRAAAEARSTPDGFAESLDRVPAMLVVCANLEHLAATDRDLNRYSLVGGASIYPFVWNILLCARERALGGVMTTIATRKEQDVRNSLAIPDTFAVAAIVVLGYPERQITRLTRSPVERFSTIDTFDGVAFERPTP